MARRTPPPDRVVPEDDEEERPLLREETAVRDPPPRLGALPTELGRRAGTDDDTDGRDALGRDE